MSRTWTDQEKADMALASRLDLYTFSRWMFYQRKKYKWLRGQHHKIVCDSLLRVFNGECNRLIINIPPRYSKTELAVVNFIAWAIGQYPDCEFIHTSYSAALAVNNSAQIRDMVCSPEYQHIFPEVQIKDDSSAKDHWKTTAGGVMYATGAGGTITGFGAGKMRTGFGGALIIDDPHKADEARSDVMRQNVIDWFQNTLESRLNNKTTPIIVIMQRLHEKDLAGWLLNGGNGETWEHVCIPAINPDGSALWPDKHDIDRLRKMEQASPYTFAGQYMQNPVPPGGAMFKPEHVGVIDAIPAGTRFVRGWDLAASVPKQGSDPDWTAGIKMGVTPAGRYVIADVVRTRGLPDEVQAVIRATAQRDGMEIAQCLPQDPGQAGKAQVSAFARLLAGFSIRTSPESGDKETRAEPFAAQVNIGNVDMLRGAWNDVYVNELTTFPFSGKKDQVDASSRAFSELHSGSTGILDFMRQQSEEAKQKLPTWAQQG